VAHNRRIKHYRQINITITINKKHYTFLAHRLAWLYMTGEWPEKHIDHINGEATDNRFVNLRDVAHEENSKNLKIRYDNTSGFTGVNLHKIKYKDKIYEYWLARIMVDYKNIKIGLFKNKQDGHRRTKKCEH